MSQDIFEEYKELPKSIIEEIKRELVNRKVTQAQLKQILERIKREYVEATINPGEAIGIITAESFGEPGTQMTLNVKHFSGVAEVAITLGLPRLIEIFDARASPSTPSMEIYIKKEYNKDPEKVRKIASQIKETKLEDVILDFSTDLIKMVVKATIDKTKLRDIGMTEPTLQKVLSTSVKNAQVKVDKSEITFKLKSTDHNVNDLYAFKEKLKSAFIKGVKNITHVLPIKRKNEFVILTAGANLREVLQLAEIDASRTVSNDIHEVFSVFGIEAARQAIMNEALNVIENQGLDIDIRHLMLIADAMTNKGVIKGITRGGITGEKESVLARASFETPINHIMNAAFSGEVDNFNSVIENVILNQEVPIGTGLPELIAKMKNDGK